MLPHVLIDSLPHLTLHLLPTIYILSPIHPLLIDAMAIFFSLSPNKAFLTVSLKVSLKQKAKRNIFKQNNPDYIVSVYFLLSKMGKK